MFFWGGVELEDDIGRNCDELKIINGSLRACTIKIREKMFLTLYKLNEKIIESLRGVEGAISFEDARRDKIVFALPLTPVTTKINYPSVGYSLKDLIFDSKNECYEHLNSSFKDFVKVINQFELKNGTDIDNEKIFKWYDKSALAEQKK